MTIYHVYEKSTGGYAGSGVKLYNDNAHGSTEIPVPFFGETESAIFNGEKWVISPRDTNLAYQRQLRLALIRDGISLAAIEDAIKSLPAPASAEALVEWEYSQVIDKNNSLVTQISQLLGYNQAKIDEIFETARRL